MAYPVRMWTGATVDSHVSRTESTCLRVFLVDDNVLIRDALVQVLLLMPNVAVVGSAGDADSALADIAELAPDVVILDVNLPGRSGFQVLQEMRADEHQAKVIVFTVENQNFYRAESLRLGADYFFCKSLDNERLMETVSQLVLKGKTA